MPHWNVSAAAVPPDPAANPVGVTEYWNVVPLGMAVTAKVPLYPTTLTSSIVTLSPMVRPAGFAALVTVTVVPLSAVEVIGLAVPGHRNGVGMVLVSAVKVSVVGLYNSAVFNPTCPLGTPELAGGVTMLRNELPFEPPTISTWPSSEVPLPSIRVVVGPVRAEVIVPPLPVPANVNVWV